jgi:hypothetical protein
MDNRNESTEVYSILLELINLMNREPRQPRTNNMFNQTRRNNINNFYNQTNSRFQTSDSIYRQQIYDIISQYNTNINEHQNIMREYNEIILYALELLYENRPTRNSSRSNTSTNFNTGGFTTNNTRNYLSASSGFRGLFSNTFNTTRNIPFNNIFSEPVIVRPTNEQINLATRTFNYNTMDLSNNIRCPISLEEFQENDCVCEIKHCRHLFKKQSIMDWFQRNVRCPVCRYDIRNYSEANINETPNEEEPNDENLPYDDNSLFDSSPFYMDLSLNSINRTQSPIRRQNSPNLNTEIINSVNNQINNIATNISSIINNYIDPENSDMSSNVFTFEIPIIYFDLSNTRI